MGMESDFLHGCVFMLSAMAHKGINEKERD